jgi:hypothetical protein
LTKYASLPGERLDAPGALLLNGIERTASVRRRGLIVRDQPITALLFAQRLLLAFFFSAAP